MRDNEFKKSEEFLRDYIDVIEEAQAAEFSKFMDDESVEEKPEKHKRRSKSSPKPNRLVKYAAIFITAITIVSIIVPVEEVSAWVVWRFDAIFGEHDDHTEIKPNDEGDFLQYYVSEPPKGYEIISESNDDFCEIIQYVNAESKYIMLFQMKKEGYVTDLDNENRNNRYERINEFEVLVSESIDGKDIAFEIITDQVAILIQTNDNYETGKSIINNLKIL